MESINMFPDVSEIEDYPSVFHRTLHTVDPFGRYLDERIKKRYGVTRILKSGPYTHVFWADGTKTSVRRAHDEEDNDYAAFTAALAIKMCGSNSALKRMIEQKVEVQKPKKKTKQTGCTDTCPIDYEQIERDLAASRDRTVLSDAT